MFIDIAKIKVKAGDGGDGAVAFHREKYVASGGPDGGDGGRGGDIVFRVDDNLSTLADFRYKRKYTAERGENGRGKRCFGKSAQPLVITVPRGTLIRNAETGRIMADMSTDEDVVIAKGGRGGWGNTHFASPTRQTPRFAKPGTPGEAFELQLELKLLADVGLVGFPNVGKSTLVSVVSEAKPNIANYHFTTITPVLGVVHMPNAPSFVMADIPGLIEGAWQGVGLGHQFLRHVERCRMLIHIVDVSGSEGRDPVTDFEAINAELREYSPALASRPQIVAANKCDLLCGDRENIERLKSRVEELGYEFFEMSAVTHEGTRELVKECSRRLSQLPPVLSYKADYVPPAPVIDSAEELLIQNFDDMWTVEGPWLQRLVATVNFSDYESRMYFDRVLREAGVYQRMEEMGVKDGDTVSMYDLMFEYKD